MHRFLLVSFRRASYLVYENMLEIHIPERVSFLQSIPLVFVLEIYEDKH